MDIIEHRVEHSLETKCQYCTVGREKIQIIGIRQLGIWQKIKSGNIRGENSRERPSLPHKIDKYSLSKTHSSPRGHHLSFLAPVVPKYTEMSGSII